MPIKESMELPENKKARKTKKKQSSETGNFYDKKDIDPNYIALFKQLDEAIWDWDFDEDNKKGD